MHRRILLLSAALVLAPLPALAQAAPKAEAAKADTSGDPSTVQAGSYKLDSAHGKITWSVNHLGFSTYMGQFSGVEGTLVLDPKEPAKSQLEVKIDPASIGTLNADLDKHVKGADFLDTAKFPTASFKSTKIETTGPKTARVTGDLTLRGVTKPVTLTVQFNKAGVHPVDKIYTVGFDGEGVIKRSQFGVNAFLPALGDEVTLKLEGEFKASK